MSRLRRAAALQVKASDAGPAWAALSVVLTDAARRFCAEVTVRCYPRASAPAPGCCYPDIGAILLDGELISDPERLGRGEPGGEQRSELAALVGVLAHECGHARHTLPETMRAVAAEGYLEELKVLEEARMERRLCERRPLARRFIRAAVAKINAPHLPEPGRSIGRAEAARLGAILGGRAHAGTLPSEIEPRVDALVAEALGSADAAALRAVVRDAAACADDDVAGLLDACRRYRELARAEDEAGARVAIAAGSLGELAEALAEAEVGARSALAEQGGEDDDGNDSAALRAVRDALEEIEAALGEERERAERRAQAGERLRLVGRLRGAGAPDGRNPGAAPGAAAGPAERGAARELERRLRRARSRRTAREGAKAPGRFHSGGALRREAERRLGRPPRSDPYRRRVEVRAGLWAPEVALVVDNSGSMSAWWAELGQVAWIAHEAIRRLGGRVAIAVFGAGAELVVCSRERLGRVPEFRTGGGTGHLDRALRLAAGELRFADPRRPRLCVIVSDGDLWGTEGAEPEIERLRGAGVGVIQVGIGAPPAELGASRTVVVSDALEVGEVVGEACVEALAEARGVR